MLGAKALIALLFTLMVVLGVAGLFIYYQALEPLRLVARCSGPASVLDKVTYLEYNITDSNTNITYIVKVTNDPAGRSGTGVLLAPNGSKLVEASYKYSDTGLTSISIRYANGSTVNATGIGAARFEEAFYTSLVFNYNQTSGNATISLFPGIAPVYFTCYLGRATNISWQYYASIRKPRTPPTGMVTVEPTFGTAKYKGGEVEAVILTIARTGAVVNKWTIPTYTIVLTDINGVPAALTIVVDVRLPNNPRTYTMGLIDLQTK